MSAYTPLSLEDLVYRPFILPSAALDQVVVPGPCVIDALYMTTIPTAVGHSYTMFDGLSAGGTVVWQGTNAILGASPLRIKCVAGLYIIQTGGAGAFASWVIMAAALPSLDS